MHIYNFVSDISNQHGKYTILGKIMGKSTKSMVKSRRTCILMLAAMLSRKVGEKLFFSLVKKGVFFLFPECSKEVRYFLDC